MSLSKLITRFLLIFVILLLCFFWIQEGFAGINLDTDLGRDLFELSNIFLHKWVWLGPRLSAGFHTSPIYYYILYPALLLSGNNPRSIIILTLLFAAVALFIFGLLGIKKWGGGVVLAIIIIGLQSWWQTAAVHPGNGYTYVIWVFLSLTFMWFELPLFVSALFLGLAISYHPAAVFILPVLFYEWWRKKHKIFSFFLILLGLTIPWTPIILFEFITKGYLIRQWSSHPGFGLLQPQFNLLNLLFVSVIWAAVGLIVQNRIRIWYWLSLPGLLFLIMMTNAPSHYLLGIICLMWFVATVALLNRKHGQTVLLLISVFLFVNNVILAKPIKPAARPISKIEAVAKKLVNSGKINKKNKIAVVAMLSADNKVPQADDYRFFLRTQGYKALDITEYSQADRLIMFIEVPNFEWQHWSTWEIEQFGKKKFISQLSKDKTKIIIFER